MHVGLLEGRDRLDALAAANVVVYPSRHEVFGLVPLEALLCGSPVIVCNDSGAGELIGTVGGGEVVPVDDVDSLAVRDRVDARCRTPVGETARASPASKVRAALRRRRRLRAPRRGLSRRDRSQRRRGSTLGMTSPILRRQLRDAGVQRPALAA